ncbi:MAG: NADPH-dependent assimilatory sulfite reductase hemoprotein subunit [Acidobacteriaceae bacterium]|nr:NADPH-dependent assimilatory sulfite reductase hemoprotein subunit [Acidobacteriaceae bacterium]
MDKALSAAEKAKLEGKYLRGPIAEELENSAEAFSGPATGVLKFHGVYQQDDRDLRKQGTKQYTAMVRVGVPGGVLTAGQYLTLDRLADLGDGSIRITTRQDVQYHYVPKARLRELMRELNNSYLTTLAACGDVVRNVTSCPAPFQSEERRELQPLVAFISRSLKPKTTAYYEIWIEGEQAVSAEAPEGTVEPLYGATYLPRKFKIGFAFPGDNTTDIYSNDVGIVPEFEGGRLSGFTILAGGGMGQSAGVKASHPRLADPICSIGPEREELLEVVAAIVAIHRDFGNRSNRKLARLKYVMDAWGVEKFKQELEARVGRELAPPKALTWRRANDYLGWHRQGADENGRLLWFLGIPVISGRVKDFDESGAGERRLRGGIRAAVERYGLEVRLTCQQNLYLSGIRDCDRFAVSALLREHGVMEAAELPPVLRHAMACPALPTCGQAITESERMMPALAAEIQAALNAAGLRNDIVHVRTTGCPNGCARPYTAEVGIVGASINMYTVYLGASPLGDRLGTVFAQNVKRGEIVSLLRPVFERYKEARRQSEGFGDFCHRTGVEALRELAVLTAA